MENLYAAHGINNLILRGHATRPFVNIPMPHSYALLSSISTCFQACLRTMESSKNFQILRKGRRSEAGGRRMHSGAILFTKGTSYRIVYNSCRKFIFYTEAENSTLQVSFSRNLCKKFLSSTQNGTVKVSLQVFALVSLVKNIATRLFTSHFSVKEITIS